MIWLVFLMALEFAHAAVHWLAADGVGVTYTISGLPFAPKAIRVYTCGLQSAVDAVSGALHLRQCGGFATSPTDRRCVAIQDQDAAAAAVCTTGYRTDCVAMTLTSTPAADGLLDVDAFLSDGVRFIVDDQGVVNITVFVELWGGDDITVQTTLEIAEPAATGNQSYTVTGFTSDGENQVVLLFGVQETGAAPAVSRNDSGFMQGWASGTAVGENIVSLQNSDDGSTTMDCDGYSLSGECLAMIVVAGGNPNARAVLNAWQTDAFQLNWIARAVTNRKYIALAMKGGQWRAGDYALNANTINNTVTVSGLPFPPTGVLIVMNGTNAEDAAGVSHGFPCLCMGCASSISSRRAMVGQSLFGAADATIHLGLEYDEVVILMQAGTVIRALIDVDAMLADGFRLITDQAVPGGGPTNLWGGYLAFASEPGDTLFAQSAL